MFGSNSWLWSGIVGIAIGIANLSYLVFLACSSSVTADNVILLVGNGLPLTIGASVIIGLHFKYKE